MIRRCLAVALAVALLLPVGGAFAAQPQFSMSQIETELMCPTCQSRLDMSQSPAAERIRAFVEEKRAAGWTKEQVKAELVKDFGPAVLAAPPIEGVGLVAWVTPGALVLGGVAVVIALVVIWRRREAEQPAPAPAPADGELDARVDAALREFDDD